MVIIADYVHGFTIGADAPCRHLSAQLLPCAIAEVIIIEVDCDPNLYPKVNGILGLDPKTGAGDWPKGLLTHIGSGGEGTVVVVELWESCADQESWMAKLGPALEQAGVGKPKRMEWLSLLGNINP
ncbi:MAG: hypothetical protein ACLQRH_15160 [Acidimicrobiales bacterium]